MSKHDGMPSFDFTEFPSIEIDSEFWDTLSSDARIKYLFKLLFQEKDIASKIKMLNFILKTIGKLSNALITNKDVKGYLTLMGYAGDMISASMAIGKLFKSKQTYRNNKNNEIAKLMGLANGNLVNEHVLDVTNAMVEAFLDISDRNKEKYNITIDNVVNDDKGSGKNQAESDDSVIVLSKKITIVGTYGKDDKSFKYAMSFNMTNNVFDGDSTIAVSHGKLFTPTTGMNIETRKFIDEIHKIFHALFIEKVDVSRNFIKVNGTKLEICPRINIREDIVNVDIERISVACTKTLNDKRRRGVVLVGEPGTGKTIAVHKIINKFKDRLTFWVSADSINTINGIRSIRKLFKMFEGCIVVFDDLDAAPLTNKNETTNEFLAMLDGTNKMSCFMLATVNDPSKIHMTVINRPERFDDIYHVRKPESVSEVADIFISKAFARGYRFYDKNVNLITPKISLAKGKEKIDLDGKVKSKSKSMSLGLVNSNHNIDEGSVDGNGFLLFSATNPAFIACCEQVIEGKFTQVMVAGLVNDCDTYTKTRNITIKHINEAIAQRLESIKCANMVAIKGRLEVNMNEISDEAKAGLNSNSR